MNALIQGSAARHTKLWMRACWREGIVPLLQMHDALDCSVASPKLAERVAQLGREAVTLEVPMQVDLKFGADLGRRQHTWEEVQPGPRLRASRNAASRRKPNHRRQFENRTRVNGVAATPGAGAIHARCG